MDDRELLEMAAKGRRQLMNPVGTRFGRLVVVREVERVNPRKRQFLCKCDCGTETSLNFNKLRSGHTRSCGCLHLETILANLEKRQPGKPRHGRNKSPEHRAWVHMRQRCNNPNKREWEHYGGRGICVCERWAIFENFLADMGDRPSPSHSLDRINVDGNYEPGNCRWATQQQQIENTRVVRMIELRGRVQSLSAWARERGLARGQINGRLNAGWSMDEAVFTPSVPGQKRHRNGSVVRAAAEIGRSHHGD